MEKDFYDILGVSRSASESEIKSAYHGLAQKYHPDVNKGDKTATEKFKEISNAYEIIGNSEKRKKYDEDEINHKNYTSQKDDKSFGDAGGMKRQTGKQILSRSIVLFFKYLFIWLVVAILTKVVCDSVDIQEGKYFARFTMMFVFVWLFNILLFRLISSCVILRFLKIIPDKNFPDVMVKKIIEFTSWGKSLVTILLSLFLAALIYYFLQSFIMTYAFSGSDNSFINWIVELCSNNKIIVNLFILAAIYITIALIIIRISMIEYCCPKCKNDFVFFTVRHYRDNEYKGSEQVEESYSGVSGFGKQYHGTRLRTVTVEYYDYHTVKKCLWCGYESDTYEQRKDVL